MVSSPTRVSYALSLPRGWWELADGETATELVGRIIEQTPDAAAVRHELADSVERATSRQTTAGARVWVLVPQPQLGAVEGVFGLRFFPRDGAAHDEYLYDATDVDAVLHDRTIAEYDDDDRSIALVHDIVLTERDDDPLPVTSRATVGVFPKRLDVVLEVSLTTHDVLAFSDLPGYALKLARSIDFESDAFQ